MADFRVDAHEFSRLMNELKGFDKKLSNGIRKELREAGKPAVKAVREKVKEPPPSGGRSTSRISRTVKRRKSSKGVDFDGETITERWTEEEQERTNVRSEIARGVAVRTSTAASGGSIKIVASSKHLPEDRKPMARLYNKEKGWRHPTFGNRNVWHHQRGNPYFDEVLNAHADKFREAVLTAMRKAAEALARRI